MPVNGGKYHLDSTGGRALVTRYHRVINEAPLLVPFGFGSLQWSSALLQEM